MIMKSKVIERFGGLVKEEQMSCIEKEFRISKTCLLESTSPFAGYYPFKGGIPPHYIYIILEGNPTFWKVALAVENIRQKVSYPFDAAFCELCISGDRNAFAIRVRDLEEYNHIHDLQLHFAKEGLKLKKNSKVDSETVLIRLEKFFYLVPWEDGMFLGKQQLHHGYFIIPKKLGWEEFKEITKEASTDVNLLYFDAALGYFYENKKIVNMIRIYREQLTRERLKAIMDKYLMLMNK